MYNDVRPLLHIHHNNSCSQLGQSDKGANKSLAVVAAFCILSISRPDNCLVSKNVYYCHMKYDV